MSMRSSWTTSYLCLQMRNNSYSFVKNDQLTSPLLPGFMSQVGDFL